MAKFTTVINGDIFESKDEALVCPVNCVGVMGAGLAKEFKIRFPDYFYEYTVLCDEYYVRLGEVHFHKSPNRPTIVSFPTKNHWRDKSEKTAIYDGLESLAMELGDIKSISIPAIGCGLGGLNWKQVKSLIESSLKFLSDDVTIHLYPPRLWQGN